MTAGFAGLAPCVHCGFCLQTCPTFVETGDEADGPRGRILLMQGLANGTIDPTDAAAVRHLDRCLGCRACETVCPSGVTYGSALEAARHVIVQAGGVPLLARVVLAVMAEPTLRAPVTWAARIARRLAPLFAGRGRAGFAWGMLAATRQWSALAHVSPSGGEAPSEADAGPAPHPPRRSAVFYGCIQRDLLGHVNRATERTLRANRHRTVAVIAQGCCGALHAHAGMREAAQRLARANVRAFQSHSDAEVVVNAAGCGAMLKSYGELLSGEPIERDARAFASRVRDVSETLATTGPRRGAPLPLRVAYDAPCHLEHAQRVVDPPRAVLAAIPGLTVVEHEDADRCCGSAGIYSLLESEMSRAVLARKIATLRRAAPDAVVTGNPGCMMQIGAGCRADRRPLPVVHPVELLDHSYALAGYYGEHA